MTLTTLPSTSHPTADGDDGHPLREVVVGVDGTHAAGAWRASVAGPLELEVCEPIVECVPPTSKASVWTKVRAELEGPWTERLRQRGVACSTHLVEGINVGATLTHHARRCHADAVVVGLGGPAGHRRRHPATELLERCHLPVILIPVEAVADQNGSRG